MLMVMTFVVGCITGMLFYWANSQNPNIPATEYDTLYTVAGAGTLALGTGIASTGTATGMHVGVSWGRCGFAGGVIDIEELCKMRDQINDTIKTMGYTEPSTIEDLKT